MCTVDQAGAAQLLRIGRRFISPMGPSHPVILSRHSRSAQSPPFWRGTVRSVYSVLGAQNGIFCRVDCCLGSFTQVHQPALASATARYQSGHFRGRPAGAVRRGDGEPVRLGADKDHIGEREEIRGPFQQLVAKLAARDLPPKRPYGPRPARRVDGASLRPFSGSFHLGLSVGEDGPRSRWLTRPESTGSQALSRSSLLSASGQGSSTLSRMIVPSLVPCSCQVT